MTALPPIACELEELIDLPATLDLVQARGGRVIYVPQRPLATSEITQIIGLQKARRLAERYGGSTLTVPMCTAALRARRDAEIYRLHYDHGRSIDQLAGEYGVHFTTVCRALRRHADPNTPSPQPDLFD